MLYLLASAATPVLDLDVPILAAQAQGWGVHVALTPTAADWTREYLGDLEELTGHPVRWESRRPGEEASWPPARAVVVAPATLATINRIALGLGDNVAVRAAIEAMGRGTPLVVLPCLNELLAAHPQFARSVEVLRGAGARVLLGEGGFTPNPSGGFDRAAYPWGAALKAAGL